MEKRKLFLIFLYPLIFVLLYFLTSMFSPFPLNYPANYINQFKTCENNTYLSLVMLATTPFSPYEIPMSYYAYKTPINLLFLLNFTLPLLIILATAVYLILYQKKSKFSIHWVFGISVAASYLWSFIYWKFGSLIPYITSSNCPSTGTSILGVSLSAFLCLNLLIDLNDNKKKYNLHKKIKYAILILILLSIISLYLTNGIQHAYGLIIFTILILGYLKNKKKPMKKINKLQEKT